jgi:transposase InsO family protein
MADKVVPVDVRLLVVNWPSDALRGEVTRFCARHAVSRSWFYELRGRAVREEALSALQPRPREPRARHPQAIALEIEELAVRIRKELADQGLDHGPVTVRFHLLQSGVPAPAVSTLARIFNRRGLVIPQPQKRPRSSYRRFVFAQVHECWQLDALEWKLADGSTCVIFQLLDDCSRYLLGSLVAAAETSAAAIAVTRTAIEAFQVPCVFLSDNGVALNRDRLGVTTQLVAYLRGLGAKPITGRPSHPQTQGKDERVHQPLQNWLRAHPAAESIAELQSRVDEFDEYYNHTRPHQSLQMRTPAQALAQGPIALAPQPPSAVPGQEPVRALVRPRRVAANGNISVNKHTIQLGWEHAKTQVTVLWSQTTVNVFDHRGHHIRTVILEPGKTYYGNGRPKGGRHPNRKVSTLT